MGNLDSFGACTTASVENECLAFNGRVISNTSQDVDKSFNLEILPPYQTARSSKWSMVLNDINHRLNDTKSIEISSTENAPVHISAYSALEPGAVEAVLKNTWLRPSLANIHPGTSVGPDQLLAQLNLSSLAASLHTVSLRIRFPAGHFTPSPSFLYDVADVAVRISNQNHFLATCY